jgi:hypothetical protein
MRLGLSHREDEQRLMVCENRVLKRIFVHTEEEVTGEWRKLNYDEFHNFTFRQILLECSIKEDEISEACSAHNRGIHTKFW